MLWLIKIVLLRRRYQSCSYFEILVWNESVPTADYLVSAEPDRLQAFTFKELLNTIKTHIMDTTSSSQAKIEQHHL